MIYRYASYDAYLCLPGKRHIAWCANRCASYDAYLCLQGRVVRRLSVVGDQDKCASYDAHLWVQGHRGIIRKHTAASARSHCFAQNAASSSQESTAAKAQAEPVVAQAQAL